MQEEEGVGCVNTGHQELGRRRLEHLIRLLTVLCTTLRRKRKAVVVSIRGTMSLADIVTDAVVHPEGIDDWLPPVFSKVHTQPSRAPLSAYFFVISSHHSACHVHARLAPWGHNRQCAELSQLHYLHVRSAHICAREQAQGGQQIWPRAS